MGSTQHAPVAALSCQLAACAQLDERFAAGDVVGSEQQLGELTVELFGSGL
ncbi:MAG TPA: hypothetical protein VJR89_08060 [Polyangiales bacterium]|nr:hypothetical protein [Polyangiales bacterium]